MCGLRDCEKVAAIPFYKALLDIQVLDIDILVWLQS